MHEICICILNYNNSKKTVACLESVLRQQYHSFSVLITDNASTDDSVLRVLEYLSEKNITWLLKNQGESLEIPANENPGVVILRSSVNGGFSSGNNLSLVFVRQNPEIRNVLLLNNDVILNDDFFKEITGSYRAAMMKNPGLKVALGASEYGSDKKFHHHGIHHLHILSGLVFAKPVFPSYAYIVGACMFLPADVPDMDEGYFLYYDDAAYSKILQARGYLISTCNKAGYIHDAGTTTRHNPQLHRIIFRSMRRFYTMHYPAAYPFVIFFRVLLELLRGRIRIAGVILSSAFRK